MKGLYCSFLCRGRGDQCLCGDVKGDACENKHHHVIKIQLEVVFSFRFLVKSTFYYDYYRIVACR